MLEKEFETFLMNDENISSKTKAILTRLSKARAVEKALGKSLDMIVADDNQMYQALLDINRKLKNNNGAYSNALRKYYIFKNKTTFPQIKEFEKNLKKIWNKKI